MPLITLRIEKPVAGGRMLARHDGAIVLVAGALPGEVVEVSVERTQRGTMWASTVNVVEASPHRVTAGEDATCGGSVYAHAGYEHQRELKSLVIADAFTRVGRMTLDAPVPVRVSAPDGYRMRARLHARRGRIGFFREGTHDLCDAGLTRQLLPATLEVVRGLEAVVRELPRAGLTEIEISENRAASERACHLELAPDGDPSRLANATTRADVNGVSYSVGEGGRTKELWGSPYVSDVLDVRDADGVVQPVRLTRHARVFFQGNRHLLDDLVQHVLSRVPDGPAIDLYAGVGLFSVPLAARRRGAVVAVEADRLSSADLTRNAEPYADRLAVHSVPVEATSAWASGAGAATVIVDPPRTGLSRDALTALIAAAPARLVYVSCDVATLARDVRGLSEGGYRVTAAEAFDLFPGTAHVETVMVLER